MNCRITDILFPGQKVELEEAKDASEPFVGMMRGRMSSRKKAGDLPSPAPFEKIFVDQLSRASSAGDKGGAVVFNSDIRMLSKPISQGYQEFLK